MRRFAPATAADNVLTLGEAMRCARMRREDFYTLPDAYKPRHYRVGKRIYITRQAVTDWIAAMESAGTVPRER